MAERRKDTFDFKLFRIKHDRCTMKVGTDAVLLGAWVSAEGASHVLDIGTGSGVIALMLAQRTESIALIDAVELEEEDAKQARENVMDSPWPAKVVIHHSKIQDFHPPHPYDLIVSNPPFFSNSWLPPNNQRKQARHTQTLTHVDLLQHVKRLLAPQGIFAIVLPTVEGDQFKLQATAFGLFCQRSLAFFSREGKPQERWLLEFSLARTTPTTEKLVLYQRDEIWTEDYTRLTFPFYLPR